MVGHLNAPTNAKCSELHNKSLESSFSALIFITMKMDFPEGWVRKRAGHKVGEKPPGP